jgi:hypothetical protein
VDIVKHKHDTQDGNIRHLLKGNMHICYYFIVIYLLKIQEEEEEEEEHSL